LRCRTGASESKKASALSPRPSVSLVGDEGF